MDSPDCSEHIRFLLFFRFSVLHFLVVVSVSGVTMRWLLRLVTGAPLVGPDSSTVLNESEGP